MGLKDKMLKKSSEITNQRPTFTPLELNEGNVQAIFNRCLSKDEEKVSFDKTFISQILKPTLTERESKEIILSRENVNKNRQVIKFLFGQVKNIHGDCSAIGLQEGFLRYNDTIWTRDYDILFELYCLSQSCGLITDFSALPEDHSIISAIKASNCTPTLSPKDPNFPAWWEEHKSEWKEPKKEGKEPSDD